MLAPEGVAMDDVYREPLDTRVLLDLLLQKKRDAWNIDDEKETNCFAHAQSKNQRAFSPL